MKTVVASTEIMVHDWIGTLVMGEATTSQGYELGFKGNPINFLSEYCSKNQISQAIIVILQQMLPENP